MATLTSGPSTSAVRVAGVLEHAAVSAGSRSSAPTGWTRQRPVAARSATEVLDDLQQRLELVGGPVEVVGRQQPQRDDLDAELVAPAEELLDLVRAGPVAVGDAARRTRVAQRRLPSRITPTWRGSCSGSRLAASRRS